MFRHAHARRGGEDAHTLHAWGEEAVVSACSLIGGTELHTICYLCLPHPVHRSHVLRFSQAPKGVIELCSDRCGLPKSSGICSPTSPLPRSASGIAAAGAETLPSSRPASLAFPAHFPEVSPPHPAAGLLSCPFPPAPSTQQLLWSWRGALRGVLGVGDGT